MSRHKRKISINVEGIKITHKSQLSNLLFFAFRPPVMTGSKEHWQEIALNETAKYERKEELSEAVVVK